MFARVLSYEATPVIEPSVRVISSYRWTYGVTSFFLFGL